MYDTALYVLSGVALYGGIRQMYLGGIHASRHPHVLHGILYFLLLAVALGSALVAGTEELTVALSANKLLIALGIILWVSFVWFLAAYTRIRSYSALAMLTALWSLLLIANFASPLGLLYSTSPQLPATGMTGVVQTSVSRWWAIVQLMVLVSLLYALYTNAKFSRQDQAGTSIALSAGLSVLTATTILDFCISAGLIESSYLTPFGFLTFLIATSLYPGEIIRPERVRIESPMMSMNSGTRSSGLEASVREPVGSDSESGLQAGEAAAAHIDAGPVAEMMAAVDVAHQATLPDPLRARLVDLSDQLTDVAVHATMVMKRYRSGDTDPKIMQELCDKVSSEAMRSHRLANQLSRPDKRDWA